MTRERRDSKGRRIGFNWWREHNVTLFRDAHAAWSALRESSAPAYDVAGAGHSVAGMHQLSDREFANHYPQPTLKEFLLHNAGMGTDPDLQ